MSDFFDRVHKPGTSLLGTWAKLDSLETLEMLALAGFDFIVADAEHAPHTFKSLYRTIVVAQGLGMAALVRLPDATGGDAQRVLDSGADGVLVPRVRSPQHARLAMEPLLFSPRGTRGMGITSRAGRWGQRTIPDYVKAGDERVMRVVQLEDPEALEGVDAILDTDGVNAAFVGMGDLSLVSGRPTTHPENDALVDGLLAACRKRGIPCGTAVGDAEAAKRSQARGFSFVMVGNDASIFGRAASELVRKTKS
jgi:2-dehydro-3-deoxyglucarate aldolase/4-hydroxy-2-oxoheptanedioate aldolase